MRRLALALLIASPALALDVAPTWPDARPQEAQSFPVGKWPEGVVAAGGSWWVAQSGARTVARLRSDGSVEKAFEIGRLPVSMAVAPDGGVLVQVNTDQVVKRIDPKSGKVSVLARLPDGPQQMVVDGPFAWVLLWKDQSSAGSSVLRVPLGEGKVLRSADTGANAFGIAACGGRVWVARSGGQLVELDGKELVQRAVLEVGGRPMHVACAGTAVFSAGETRVARAGDGPITHLELPRAVQALGAWDDLVAASTEDGTLWILDPATLAVRHRLSAPVPFHARAIARDGQVLLLTAHDGDGPGALIRVKLP